MKYYKIVREDGSVGGKGMTADGAVLLAGQEELAKAEYDALELPYHPSAPPEPEEPELTVEQQLILTQLQQQEVLDALIIAQLGGEKDV